MRKTTGGTGVWGENQSFVLDVSLRCILGMNGKATEQAAGYITHR